MRNQAHQAWIDFTLSLEPNVVITLDSGLGVNHITFQSTVTHYLNRVQRRAHGRNWAKYPPEQKIRAVGFFEHWDTNLHLHIAANAPDRALRWELGQGAGLWRDLRRAGSHHYDMINCPEDYVSYITKRMNDVKTRDNVYVYGAMDSR